MVEILLKKLESPWPDYCGACYAPLYVRRKLFFVTCSGIILGTEIKWLELDSSFCGGGNSHNISERTWSGITKHTKHTRVVVDTRVKTLRFKSPIVFKVPFGGAKTKKQSPRALFDELIFYLNNSLDTKQMIQLSLYVHDFLLPRPWNTFNNSSLELGAGEGSL